MSMTTRDIAICRVASRLWTMPSRIMYAISLGNLRIITLVDEEIERENDRILSGRVLREAQAILDAASQEARA